MKRTIAVLSVLATALVVLPATAASADTTISASTLVTDPNYCGPGGSVTFFVSGTLEVKGGTATAPGSCTVVLRDGARIKFTNVNLTLPDTLVVVGGANTRVEVSGSTISSSRFVELLPGSSTNDTGSQLRVDGSKLSGLDGTVLFASCSTRNGLVEVTNSTVRGGSTFGVAILASEHSAQFPGGGPFCNGVGGGQVKVTGSTINAAGTGISISSTARTEARNDTFNPADTRFIHSDGECRSESNTPTSPCS
jgi:hypothetical protein